MYLGRADFQRGGCHPECACDVFDWDVRTGTFGCGLLSAVFAVRALVLLRKKKKNKTREAEGGSAAEQE